MKLDKEEMLAVKRKLKASGVKLQVSFNTETGELEAIKSKKADYNKFVKEVENMRNQNSEQESVLTSLKTKLSDLGFTDDEVNLLV